MERLESWKPVPGFEGRYEVSDMGRVRSLDRQELTPARGGGFATRFRAGRVLKPRLGGLTVRYHYAQLGRGDGTYWQVPMHRLVLTVFAGPPEPGQECLHGQGGPQDNRWPENIRWGTHAENMAEQRKGTHTSHH